MLMLYGSGGEKDVEGIAWITTPKEFGSLDVTLFSRPISPRSVEKFSLLRRDITDSNRRARIVFPEFK